MKNATFLSLTLALGLVGCTTRTLPLATPIVGISGESPAVGPTGSAVAPFDEYGTLKIDIRWPERPDYQTQVIPTSTNALIVTLRSPSTGNGPGAILAQRTITRQAGATHASETFKLKATNNLSLEVLAYQESAPDYATSKPIARGTGTVNIIRSLDNQANITLASLFAPTIKTLSTNFGKPNDVITIAGDNFGEEGTPLPAVVFGGATASVVTRASTASLTVKVPTDAKTGGLSVVVDGVTSNSFVGFWVPSALSISAAKASWDTGTPSTSRAVLFGQTLPFTATPVWVTGTSFFFGSAPQPSWSCDNAAAGSIAATGLFTAGTSYSSGTISAKLDNGQSSVTSNSLTAVTEDVTLTLAEPVGTLGAKGQDSLTLYAYNQLSDGATNSLVTYAASAGVTVNASGVATASSTVNGNITVMATSQLLASRIATTSVVVSNYVVSRAAGHAGSNGFGSLNGDALTYAQLNRPQLLALDPDTGAVLFSENSPNLRRLAGGQITTLGMTGLSAWSKFQGMAFDPASKRVYFSDQQHQRIYQVNLDNTGTAVATWSVLAGDPSNAGDPNGWPNQGLYKEDVGTAARFNNPVGLAYDAARGLLYVADSGNRVIRKIASNGTVSLHAGKPLEGGTADGGPGVATFGGPGDMILDPDGNLYVLDANTIRKVTPDGTVTTLTTSRPIYPTSLARDAAGNLFVTEDSYSYPNVIERVAPDGKVTVIAGNGVSTYNGSIGGYNQSILDGVGTSAQFSGARDLQVDASGQLYVAEFWNNLIRLVK